MSSREKDDVLGLYVERYTVSASTTLVIHPVPGQAGVLLKLFSGGTLAVSSVAASGVTLFQGASISQFVSANVFGIGTTSTILDIPIRGAFRVSAFGSTSIFDVVRKISEKLNSP